MTGQQGRAAGGGRQPAQPPLRMTRRGLIRLVQLGGTAGALGVAAVSCGIRLESGGSADAAASRGLRTRPGAAGGAAPAGAAGGTGSSTATGGAGARAGGDPGTPSPTPSPAAAAGLPGVGPTWSARLTGHDQVVLVSAASGASTRNVVRWFDRTATGTGWALRSTVAGWNGSGGWTTHHTVGDGRSPVGIYALTDAGGFDPNPGTAVPYEYSPAEYSEIVNGVRTFAHVLAIDYNRVDGTPPSNSVRPGGWSKGGSIWVHVEHNSPTQACVGIPDASLVALLRWLRPAAKPVILMGPAAILAT